MIDRLIMEAKLWQIPLHEQVWSDQAEMLVDADDIGDIYEFYSRYAEHCKSEARRTH